ncbi:MAG: LysR family transcriptional regulator [Salibaculum sp.]|jgi:LysR family glycine cleavage system transcriptional activator|uniref:LysR family transcriptional regulator n=1 Tax=Roseovarius halophilus (ex Wu et al. 2025) TaxID=3376060 RepID=UPI00286FFAFD|nr:LysR family transcriptional regulator [Salibaculum sp.]MDR9427914.1 LysR family transcriptional regulator [Salibaculum sp.]MDR9482176.1 LysR family transcriptional regulator [Salibaculum sp.]
MDWRNVPSLTALRAFEAAARLGSFSAAARDLNVTHAAVAQNVRALEAHFDTILMERQGRSMVTTAEGHRLAMALAEAFGLIGSATDDLLDKAAQRPLRIAVTPSFAANWLMPRIGGFWAEHPDLDVEIIPGVGLVDLRADGIDVAIRYGRGGWTGVESLALIPAGHVAVAAPGHVPVDTVRDLSELRGTTWLMDGQTSEERLWVATHGIDPDQERIKTFATAQLSREAARAGLGVAILPAPLVEDEIRAGRLRALFRETDSAVAYHVLTRPGVVSAARDAFVHWLQRQARAA